MNKKKLSRLIGCFLTRAISSNFLSIIMKHPVFLSTIFKERVKKPCKSLDIYTHFLTKNFAPSGIWALGYMKQGKKRIF